MKTNLVLKMGLTMMCSALVAMLLYMMASAVVEIESVVGKFAAIALFAR